MEQSQRLQIPFTQNGLYTGPIRAVLYIDRKTGMIWAEVDGDRLLLRPFQGKYEGDFKSRFHPVISSDQEIIGLKELFQNSVDSRYGSGKAKSDTEIAQFVDRDSSRAHSGNPYTGYAIIDKESHKCIGRISVGNCYDWKKGDAQSGLIIAKKHRGEKKGEEAVLLIAALISILVKDVELKVGGSVGESPLKRVTATTLDNNKEMKGLLERFGFKYERPLTNKENYSEDPRSLYVIDAQKIEEKLNASLADAKQLQISGVEEIK